MKRCIASKLLPRRPSVTENPLISDRQGVTPVLATVRTATVPGSKAWSAERINSRRTKSPSGGGRPGFCATKEWIGPVANLFLGRGVGAPQRRILAPAPAHALAAESVALGFGR